MQSLFLRKLKLLLFSILMLCALTEVRSATNVDSLQHALAQKPGDSARLLILSEIASYQARNRDEKGNLSFKKVIETSDSLLTTDFKNKDFLILQKAQSQSALGVNYYLIGNFPHALELQLSALAGFETIGERKLMGRCYVVMGAIYKQNGDLDMAKKCQNEALKLEIETENPSGKALALINVGIILFEQDSVRQAISHYQQALSIYRQINDDRGIGVGLINIGSAYYKLKKNDSAALYFEQSLQIRKRINDIQGMIYSNARLGSVLLDLGQKEEALKYGMESLQLAQSTGHIRGIRDAHELLANVYEAFQNHEQSLFHFKAFVSARDSMSDADAVRALTQAKYEFEAKSKAAQDSLLRTQERKVFESELATQKVISDKQSQRTKFLILGTIVILLSLFVLYYFFRNSKKLNRTIKGQKQVMEKALIEITKRDEEKELLLKEIHHRVKNNLQVVSSLLELQAQKGDEATQTAFADGQSRVRAMALIHEKLYRNSSIASINFQEYAQQLASQIASLYKAKKVKILIETNGFEFDIDTAVPLGLMLNELITNAFKYAFSTNTGKLQIVVTAIAEGGYELIVSDDGIGMPNDFDLKKAKSLGLRLINRLSKQLYGSTSYSNNQGAVFHITFKDTLQRKQVA